MRIFEKDGPRSAVVLLFYIPALVLLLMVTGLGLLWPFRSKASRARQIATVKALAVALATILYRLIKDQIPQEGIAYPAVTDWPPYSVSVSDWPVRSPYYKTVDLGTVRVVRGASGSRAITQLQDSMALHDRSISVTVPPVVE